MRYLVRFFFALLSETFFWSVCLLFSLSLSLSLLFIYHYPLVGLLDCFPS